jgi:hypothetical protein
MMWRGSHILSLNVGSAWYASHKAEIASFFGMGSLSLVDNHEEQDKEDPNKIYILFLFLFNSFDVRTHLLSNILSFFI